MKHPITPSLATRQHPHDGIEKSDRAHNNITQSDPSHSVTLRDISQKLAELLTELTHIKASKKALRLPDVKDLTGESRSQIYARMNPRYAAHDPTFPLPFYIGKSPRWWLREVESWLEVQAASTATRH